MKAIISGSLAYDRIMDFPGYFADHILPDKLHVLNVCFQVNGMKENFGGTAGNIAYSLKLLGGTPWVSATIGQDNDRYFNWLQNNGVSIDGIKIIAEEFTAGAYITTDKADNQITGFNPGAMKCSSDLDYAGINPTSDIVIVSPGNLDDMKAKLEALNEKAQALAVKLYEQAAAAQQAQAGAEGTQSTDSSNNGDDVVDGEFTEK